MTSTTPIKRQRSSVQESISSYELLYWPVFPGRDEHIRLILEEAGAPYLRALSAPLVHSQVSDQNVGNSENPPPLAPPILKHGSLLLSQTSNIPMYLGRELELAGTVGNLVAPYHFNALALTALDGLSDEAHDCHHPISKGAYSEEQVEEAKKKSKAYIGERLPKFLGYFQRVLMGEASGAGPWLYGGMLTYADLVLFQCISGVSHAFPNTMSRFRKDGNYEDVFKLYEAVKKRPNIKAYLASNRRRAYGIGIYRYYPELDE